MIQSLFDGCDAARIFAADHIFDLFRKLKQFLFYDLFILDDVDCDVVIDESQDIQIHKIDRAFDLHNIFASHLAAFRIFDDRHAAVQFVQMQIFVNLHTFSGFDVIEHKSLGNLTYA